MIGRGRAGQDHGDGREQAATLVRLGDAARDARNWSEAADRYRDSLALVPDAAIRVQLAHALKEAGRFDDAVAAYRRAADEAPTDADPLLHLGHLLKRQNRFLDASAAFAEALRRNPGDASSREGLIELGRRDLLPDSLRTETARVGLSERLAALEQETERVRAELLAATTFAVSDYDLFRRRFPLPKPPTSPAHPCLILVRAAGTEPQALRATLTSLMDQTASDWSAMVVGADDLSRHPVVSLQTVDPRIAFLQASEAAFRLEEGRDPVLVVESGTTLEPEGLAWLSFALARTGADAVICDHDRREADWRRGGRRSKPSLGAAPSLFELETTPEPPVAWMVDLGRIGPSRRRDLAHMSSVELAAARRPTERIAHLPMLLASVAETSPAPGPDVPTVRTASEAEGVLAVVPTHNQPALLVEGVRALIETAASPQALKVRVLDNRGRSDAMRQALATVAALPGVEVLAADEPFNWSRLNNQAVRDSRCPLLLFANDDTVMRTPGWDDRLRAYLGRPGVGAVGARLLYPDGTLQHGGILMGIGTGGPIHDGRGAPADEGGPLDRWRRSRPAAAVTGAFLACRRDTFDAVGGFDERLAIAFNDIDFCLKIRALGQTVLYAADIELIHHESKTRGRNDSPAKVAWDEAELADMQARWGSWLHHDPGRNPQWASAYDRPYDGIRALSVPEVLHWLDATAVANPWAIDMVKPQAV